MQGSPRAGVSPLLAPWKPLCAWLGALSILQGQTFLSSAACWKFPFLLAQHLPLLRACPGGEDQPNQGCDFPQPGWGCRSPGQGSAVGLLPWTPSGSGGGLGRPQELVLGGHSPVPTAAAPLGSARPGCPPWFGTPCQGCWLPVPWEMQTGTVLSLPGGDGRSAKQPGLTARSALGTAQGQALQVGTHLCGDRQCCQ